MKGIPKTIKGILDEPEVFFKRLKSGGRLHFLAVATGAFFSLGMGFVLAEVAFPFVRSTAFLVTVGVVLAVAVFLANASVWWIACKAVGGRAGWAHFVNAWGCSLLPVAAVAVPLAIVMLVVGNGFLRVLTTPIAAVGGVVLLLLVVAALLTLSLRYAVFERVMGLPWWRIAAAVVVFGVVMSVPRGLYSGYATITYSTSDLAFFELMKPTLFGTYPSPGGKQSFTVREADNLFLRTPYMRENPQRGDIVLYVPESDLDLDLGLEHAAMRFPGLAGLAMGGVTSVMTRGSRFAARIGQVVACPGETVALRDGVVYVDGAREAFSPAVGAEVDSSRTSSSASFGSSPGSGLDSTSGSGFGTGAGSDSDFGPGANFSSGSDADSSSRSSSASNSGTGSGPGPGSIVTAVATAGSSSTSLDPTPLGEDEFFVIGDNRNADTGRVVKKEQILGRYPRLRLALNRASIPTVLRLGHDGN
ncbi:MAG: S26 family signal peptidase [Bacillota bacterium]|nr:S26 family signal peptidase [Bacillota bacterium]